jgi:DNA-binding IclR family transcriptional regulator
MSVRQPPERKLPNLATARAVRALEVLAFQPSSTMEVAATMGLHPRTARRVLRTLQAEGYVEQRRGVRSRRYVYSLTPRLLALAGQLAARLPAVTGGQQAVRQLHQCTGLCACLVMPSYGDVIVLASAGPGAPLPWSLMPATDSAGGRVLLAYRHTWRDRGRPSDEPSAKRDLEAWANDIRDRGHAICEHRRSRSIAVPVPAFPAPLAAVVLTAPLPAATGREDSALLNALHRAATELGKSEPRHANIRS